MYDGVHWKQKKDAPLRLSGGCAVSISNDIALVIGGRQDYEVDRIK